MPLGIMYLSSYLQKQNEIGNVEILDYVLNMKNITEYQKIEDFIREVAKKDVNYVPDILAVSLMFSASQQFFDLCINILKSMWPYATSIVGGVHATNCSKQIIENICVDYVARGEAEIAFSEFVKQYSNVEPIVVKGIYSKKNINSVSQLELCLYVEDLDNIPFPDWNLIKTDEYISEKGRKKNIGNAINSKIASIVTTRGCPFKCTFCSSHTVHGRKLRFRSVENIIAEIKLLYEKYGVTLFIPEDDLFTVKKERSKHLLTAIKSLNIPGLQLQFTNALSINTLDEQVMDELIDAGMRVTYLAIESGSQYVQKYIIKKNVNLKKAREVVKYLRDRGVIVRCYIILGFPSETREQMNETIEYVKSLNVDWCSFIVATPLIGSEMYNQFVQLGYIRDDIDTWSKAIFSERNFDTPEISALELNELIYRTNLECNFINNTNKVNRNYEKAITLYNDIVETYPFHIIGWYCIMECYKHLGDFEQVHRIYEKINNLIKYDKRAYEMFHKYNDLIPNFIKNYQKNIKDII